MEHAGQCLILRSSLPSSLVWHAVSAGAFVRDDETLVAANLQPHMGAGAHNFCIYLVAVSVTTLDRASATISGTYLLDMSRAATRSAKYAWRLSPARVRLSSWCGRTSRMSSAPLAKRG